MDDSTLAQQKQLEFVLQAQGTFYAQVFADTLGEKRKLT